MISIATNACFTDDVRLVPIVSHWLRSIGSHLNEILIVADHTAPRGRIASLHGSHGTRESFAEALSTVQGLDSRVRVLEVPPDEQMRPYTRKWFTHGHPVRCQAGTVIAHYVMAIDEAAGDLVLKCDCDMAFRDRGWIREAVRILEDDEADIVEAARFGLPREGRGGVSTRPLLISRSTLTRRYLPMKPTRTDLLRRAHRALHGRPSWLTFEKMLDRLKANGLRQASLSSNLGSSLHIGRRSDFLLPNVECVIRAYEEDRVPHEQAVAGWDFAAEGWE